MIAVYPILLLNQSHPGAMFIVATVHFSLLHREYLL